MTISSVVNSSVFTVQDTLARLQRSISLAENPIQTKPHPHQARIFPNPHPIISRFTAVPIVIGDVILDTLRPILRTVEAAFCMLISMLAVPCYLLILHGGYAKDSMKMTLINLNTIVGSLATVVGKIAISPLVLVSELFTSVIINPQLAGFTRDRLYISPKDKPFSPITTANYFSVIDFRQNNWYEALRSYSGNEHTFQLNNKEVELAPLATTRSLYNTGEIVMGKGTITTVANTIKVNNDLNVEESIDITQIERITLNPTRYVNSHSLASRIGSIPIVIGDVISSPIRSVLLIVQVIVEIALGSIYYLQSLCIYLLEPLSIPRLDCGMIKRLNLLVDLLAQTVTRIAMLPITFIAQLLVTLLDPQKAVPSWMGLYDLGPCLKFVSNFDPLHQQTVIQHRF